MHPLKTLQTFTAGKSFWRVVLKNGKEYSDLDNVNDPIRGKRALDWYLDIVASGDTRNITQLWLCTPKGNAALKITEPHSAWILNTGMLNSKTGIEGVAQAIGRVDDKASGTGIAFVWDAYYQQIFKDTQACVLNLKAWRPGICNPGALNLSALGLHL